ncbi:MAG: cupin domain-containing protein [Bacteroidales bacterium]|jgi:mannose-6-phosphate isomerase-like protein (cupin superfamily)|nr:cupin domain-containing protein [Bacteroidales bacterium]MCK9499917.1 cupin domain-containing protein [Bacteroidales bacterium]MDY0314646.1 cupin domain-containing protein [Bacteroidales bacterium]NLB86456.1 cupin domain-containing protein [Bacteroidales bacterium]
MKKNLIILSLLLFVLFWSCNNQQSEQEIKNQVAKELVQEQALVEFQDYGPNPFVFDLEAYTVQNETYRTAIWTGEFMQMTVMNILPGEDIGLEIHEDHDQFLRVEQGVGFVQMGDSEDNLDFEAIAEEDFGIFIPAGKWHNVTNKSDEPLKLYSIYSPAEHPYGTVHKTQEEGLEH